MGKHDSAPTYSWVFMSGFHRRMSLAFTIILVILAAFAFIIYGKLDADCATPAQYNVSLFRYDLTFIASTKPDKCETFSQY